MQKLTMKLSFASVSLLFASASAFAPSTQQTIRTQTSLSEGLWGEPGDKEGEQGEKSKAIPFLPRPKLLDGTLAGDVGFE